MAVTHVSRPRSKRNVDGGIRGNFSLQFLVEPSLRLELLCVRPPQRLAPLHEVEGEDDRHPWWKVHWGQVIRRVRSRQDSAFVPRVANACRKGGEETKCLIYHGSHWTIQVRSISDTLSLFRTYRISSYACSRLSVYPLDQAPGEPPRGLSPKHPDAGQKSTACGIVKLLSEVNVGSKQTSRTKCTAV